jgi:hypothetical protein
MRDAQEKAGASNPRDAAVMGSNGCNSRKRGAGSQWEGDDIDELLWILYLPSSCTTSCFDL